MNPTRLFLVLTAIAPFALAEIAPPAEQIAAAVQAAPKDRQAGAAVLGYSADGKVVTLREGTNELICLASDPESKNYSVACYHKDLEPFMARGRELTAQGMKGMDRHKARWKEVDDGKVKMPKEPRMLYVMAGKGFDAAKGETIEPFLRWVVYVPYATAESTGLPVKGTTEPWLMYPGTAGAHIMITPPRPK
ncbi:MAG: hypothetical protein R2762_04475 [Bryobacteraceae bacterium]